jgi:hypothetical protein
MMSAASAIAAGARTEAIALNNAFINQDSVFAPPGTVYGYRPVGGGYSGGGNAGNF